MFKVALKKPEWTLSQTKAPAVEMSLLDPSGQALHQPVYCKDYITDAFWSEYHKQNVNIYGFQWAPGSLDKDARRFLLALTGREPIIGQHAVLRRFLNRLEAKLGFARSSVLTADDNGPFADNMLAVSFSRAWTVQPLRISLYTLLLRVGLQATLSAPMAFLRHVDTEYGEWMKIASTSYPTPSAPFGQDGSYIRAAMSTIETIVETGQFPIQTWEQYGTQGAAHSQSGIVHFKSA